MIRIYRTKQACNIEQLYQIRDFKKQNGLSAELEVKKLRKHLDQKMMTSRLQWN